MPCLFLGRQDTGYESYWNSYLKPRLEKITLRDFRTVDAANLLAELQRSTDTEGEC
jgi:hypothetical protein